MWNAGQTIGGYELVAKLRSGGMATLFLARRLGPAGWARPVAIKLIHPELARDEQFRGMFRDEAMLSLRLDHPGIARVHELGEHEGADFLVMEFVHGCSVSELTRALIGQGRRLSPAFAARIAMQVAEALHAAHETRDGQGRLIALVHRDVSPDNILLAYSGHVKLIDFGIAKATGRQHVTQEGFLKGKFRYMAPEQAVYGRPVDRRTDIYQLGIVLWELLTRRRLFGGDSDVEVLRQVRAPAVPPPSRLVDGIPAALEVAVMAALSVDPRRRPADAQTFARMLGKAMPQASEVDSGALSAMLIASMGEQRRRARETYPPDVHAGLERELETRRQAPFAVSASARKATLPYHSPAPAEPDAPSPGDRAAGGTQPMFAARARGGAAPDRAGVAPRKRRLVRIASGLKTAASRMAARGSDGMRTLGVSLAVVVTVALLLAWGTLLLRQKRIWPAQRLSPSMAAPGPPPPLPTPVRALPLHRQDAGSANGPAGDAATVRDDRPSIH